MTRPLAEDRAARLRPAPTARRVRALRHPVPVLVALVCVLVGAAVAVPATALPVLGLVALVVAVPLMRSLVRGAAWSLPVLAGLAFLLADAPGLSNAPGPGRYLPTLLVVVVIVLIGVRPDGRSRALRATACLLFGYGLIGTMYGRLVLGTVNGSLPLIGPMVIACLPPVRNWDVQPAWRLGLRALSVAGALFSVGSALSRFGVLPHSQIDVLNHEKAYLVVLGVTAALAARDRLLVLLSVAAAVFAFVAYPAATYVVAVLAALGTVVLVRWSPDASQRIVLAVGGMVGTAFAILHIDDLIALTSYYFELVGKQNNGDTRERLYQAALAQFDRPLVSDFFTGDITVVGNLAGRDAVVPVHNDYLSISLGGGLVAAAMLLGVFLYANGLALRTLAATQDQWQRRTVLVLLAAVNGAAVSALANPVFMNPGASAVTFALLAALVATCRLPEVTLAAVDPPAGTVIARPMPSPHSHP